MANIAYSLAYGNYDIANTDPYIFFTDNAVEDDVTVTIDASILDLFNDPGISTARYSFYGDSQYLYATNPIDTINFVLPEDWSLDYSSSGPGGRLDYSLLDENGAATGFIISLTGQLGTVTNVCFTRGAMIATPNGPRPIETLTEGDLVETRDNGVQPLRWIGSSVLSGEMLAQFPDLRPIRIAKDALGSHEETLVSPQHRMLLSGWRAEALFGETEVLATARSLVNDNTIIPANDLANVEYFHLLFDRHEIIMADGAWSESFHPAALGLGTASEATRDEVLALFPELEGDQKSFGATARSVLSAQDVVVLEA